MTFEEVRAALKENTGDRSQWHYHVNPGKKLGGWVRNDVKIDPGAILDPEVIVFGPGTHIRAGTQILGASVVGPHVETKGEVKIEAAQVSGDSGLRGWLPQGRTILEDSTVSHAKVHASRLSDAKVTDGAHVFDSVLESDAQVSGKNTVVDTSRLSEKARVLAGACAYNSKLSERVRVAGDQILDYVEASGGAIIDKPGTYTKEKITDNRYSTLDSLNYRWISQLKDKEPWTSSLVPAAFPDPDLYGATIVQYHPSWLVSGSKAPQTYAEKLPIGLGTDKKGEMVITANFLKEPLGYFQPSRNLPPACAFQRPAKCIYADGTIGEVTGHEGHHHGPGGHSHDHGHGHDHGHAH